jgi:HlyD family secretion protein
MNPSDDMTATRAFSRVWLVTLVLSALLIVGYFSLQPFGAGDASSRYRTAEIARGDVRQAISANGTLNPVILVNVGTQVSGTIWKLGADFNDQVQKGQILAELDPALLKAQLALSGANLANAQASLKLAQANENRARELYARGFITRAEWDQTTQARESAQAQVRVAEAQVRRDRTNLDYTVIRSPVAGVVISRNVDVGQTVAASFQTPTLFSIAQDLKRMQIDTTVAEADVGGIQAGQPARFSVDAFPDKEFHGTVRQVRMNSQIQQNVVTYNVVIDVGNPDEALLPGMTAFVHLVLAERHDVLRLPLAALRFRPESAGGEPIPTAEKAVYRLENGRPRQVPVRTGIADGKFAELLSDTLREGDAVIVEDLEEPGKDKKTQPFRVRMF